MPFLLRYYYLNGYLIGSESYLNIRLAESILDEGKITNYDYLSYGGRYFSYNIGWPFILSILHSIFSSNINVLSSIVSIIFGLISMVMIYLVLTKLKFSRLKRIFIVSLLILSPAFLYASNYSSPIMVVIALSLISFYLMINNTKINTILSLFMLFVIPIFSFAYGLLVLLIFTLYILILNRTRVKFLVLAIIFTSLVYLYYLINFGGLEYIGFTIDNKDLIDYISELGASIGLSFFAIILSLFGLYKLNANKNIKLFIYLSLFSFIISLKIYFAFIFLFSIFISIFAGIGFVNLLHMKWESDLIRKATIFILSIGILFSGVSYIGRTIDLDPDINLIEGIEFLKTVGDSSDTVASHYFLGHYINYAGKRNVMDDYFIYAPKPNRRYSDLTAFFYATNIYSVNKFIKDYSIDYIMFDDYTYNLLYANKTMDIYLPYYLNSDTNFKLIFENEGVSIWKVFQQS